MSISCPSDRGTNTILVPRASVSFGHVVGETRGSGDENARIREIFFKPSARVQDPYMSARARHFQRNIPASKWRQFEIPGICFDFAGLGPSRNR